MTGLVFWVGEVTGGMQITGIDSPSMTVGQAVVFLLATAVSNFAIGFTEELSMRGYIFQNSAERMPIWFALLLNGWIFGAMHFTAEDFSILTVLLMPLAIAFLVFARLQTGGIWLAIGWHTCWNFLQYDVFGVWGGGLWHVRLSDPDAWGGNHLLVLLLADVLFFILLRIRRNRIRLRGKLLEDGSPAAILRPIPPEDAPSGKYTNARKGVCVFSRDMGVAIRSAIRRSGIPVLPGRRNNASPGNPGIPETRATYSVQSAPHTGRRRTLR
jgi:membrane protease YdiL (CAAX protease family)